MSGKTTQANALAPRSETGLTRWNYRDEFAEMRRYMDDLFSRAFGYTPLSRLIPENGFNEEPPVDIYTTDDKVMVHTALPGYTPEAIEVEATTNTLTIQGERKARYDTDKVVPERQSGMMGESRFRIYFTLPADIDPNKVKASFRHGILELEMPKTEQAKTRSVKVEVKSA